MKYTLLLLLLTIILSGCGAPNYSITATVDRGVYQLVSVRDSSLVVIPKDKVLTEESIRHWAIVIPFDAIKDIRRGKAASAFAPLIVTATTLGGIVLGASITKEHRTGNGTPDLSKLLGAAAGGVVGLFAGYGLTLPLESPPRDLYPLQEHIPQLRSDSKYPNEEPEWLQHIR